MVHFFDIFRVKKKLNLCEDVSHFQLVNSALRQVRACWDDINAKTNPAQVEVCSSSPLLKMIGSEDVQQNIQLCKGELVQYNVAA